MWNDYLIDPDIRQAETMPASFYRDTEVFNKIRDKVFARSWQWVGDKTLVPLAGSIYPFSFMEYFIEEPLLLLNDGNNLSCLSNVCTHRGNIIAANPGKINRLICGYHGRRFNMQGQMEFMPEFGEAINFPRPCDDLQVFKLKKWSPFIFVGLEPEIDLESIVRRMDRYVQFMSLPDFRFFPAYSKEYLVHANWALYCDNYLEGFHIPFVHQELNAVLDYGRYETHLFDNMVLQVGYTDNPAEMFDLADDHPDYGKGVAAYYFWIFPNMMFNFYPWGLSVNIVRPLEVDRTRVSFMTYIMDEKRYEKGVHSLIDKVEREDEFVVEGVQRGIRSAYYKRGRYSPSREQGVHHFHRLLSHFLAK